MATRLHHNDLHRLNRRNGSAPSLASMLPRNVRRLQQQPQATAPGYCLQLNGAPDSYAALGQLATQVTTDSATFECWIQTTTTAPQAIAQTDGAAYLFSVADNKLQFNWAGAAIGGGTVLSEDARPVSDGAWHHIALVFDRGTVTFYKDGLALAGVGSLSKPVPSLLLFFLGIAPPNYGLANFNGLLYDVRVWTTARKTAEIQGFMFAQLTGLEPNLALLCNFRNDVVANQVNNTAGSLFGGAQVIQAPVPQAPPPQQVWSYQPAGDIATAPSLDAGALIYAENVAPSTSLSTGFLRAVDLQTGAYRWSYDASVGVPPNKTITQLTHALSPNRNSNVGYGVVRAFAPGQSAASNVYLDAVNLRSGQRLWRTPINASAAGQTLNFLTLPTVTYTGVSDVVMLGAIYQQQFPVLGNLGVFVAFDASQQGKPLWRIETTLESQKRWDALGWTQVSMWKGTIAVFAGLFYARAGQVNLSVLYGVNVLTGQVVLEQPLDDSSGAIGSGTLSWAPYIVGDTAYMATDDTLFAVDLNTGNILWKAPTDGQVSRPVMLGSTMYLGSSDGVSGSFYAVDASSGKTQWQLPIQGGVVTDIVTLDGVAYFASAGGSDGKPVIYSVDLATQGNDVITYTVPSLTPVNSALASNGVVYFFGENTVLSVNMDNVIHLFSVHTACTVESYDTSQSPPVGADTSYRVTFRLLDPAKKPRPFQAVKFWSADTLTITSANQTYAIGPTQPIWLETDGNGEVTLAIDAVPDPQAPLVHCPALIAWANFMLPEEAIVIYPDHENLATMSNMQATTPNPSDPNSKGLDTAKGYDGAPMLQSANQDENSRQGIANAIKNAVGSRPATARPPGSAGASATKYLAYPDVMPFALYLPKLGDPSGSTSRAFVPGATPNWNLDLSSGVVFTPASDAEAEAYFNARFRQPNPGLPGNIFTDIADFFRRVVKGAEQIASVAWRWAENAVQTIIKTAENEFHLIIGAIEDAITAVIGFLKKVINDIKQFIQFLSYLFDWDDILKTRDDILATIQSNMDKVKTWASSQQANDLAEIKAFFGDLKGKLDGYFDALIGKVQGQTIETYHARNNDPNVAYRHNGQDKSTQCTWLHQKVKDNLPNSTTGATAVRTPYTLFFPWVTHHADLGDDNPIVSAFSAFLDNLAATLAADFASVPGDVQNLINSVPQLFSNPNSFTQNALADLIDIVRDIADAILDVGEAIAEFFVNLLVAVLDELLKAAQAPIYIPVVSELYKALTGDDLSFLDVIALVVALPTTIITKLIEATAPSTSSADDPTLGILGAKIASAIFLLLGAFVDAADTAIPGGLLDGFDAAWALGNVSTLPFIAADSWTTADWVFYGIQFFPVVGNFFSALGSKDPDPSPRAKWWYDKGNFFANCVYGLIFLITSCGYAEYDAEDYGGLVLAENIIGGALPFVLDPLRIDTESLPWVAGGKLALELTSAIMIIVGYFQDNSQATHFNSPLQLASAGGSFQS